MKNLTENDPRTYAIIGAAMEVHGLLGCGFFEPVYQEALAIEFTRRKIPFQREIKFPVFYNVRLETVYKPDFMLRRYSGRAERLWLEWVGLKSRR